MSGTSKGGVKAAQTRGHDSLSQAGKKGAEARSHESRVEGGKKAAAKIGHDKLSAAGRKGAAARLRIGITRQEEKTNAKNDEGHSTESESSADKSSTSG